MAAGSLWRTTVFSAQFAALVATLACEAGSPTAPQPTSAPAPPPAGVGTIGGTVTINGQARPIVWVELQNARSGFPWAYGTTIDGGRWQYEHVPAGDYVVLVKTPPGLICDATRKPATVGADREMVVDFACVGDQKGSIQGFASNEFGTAASARVTLTGPITRDTITNRDGFFAFDDAPPGDYVVGLCATPGRVTVREGAIAFVTVDCS